MAGREQPCPYRIVEDFGGAFAMGCAAGVIWNFFKGTVLLEIRNVSRAAK